MISFEYQVTMSSNAVLALESNITAGVRKQMQHVVDLLTGNIKAQFSDAALADTVVGTVSGAGGADSGLGAEYAIDGDITSTWPAMIWYEQGRPPGGKMPPKDKIKGWAVRKGITPDPIKTIRSFAFAINFLRRKEKRNAVPIDVLVAWANRRGIVPSADFALNSMAYAIGLKIVRDGIPGHYHFRDGLQNSMPAIQASFENVVISTTGVQ